MDAIFEVELDAIFEVDPITRRSAWDRLKDPAGQPTRGNLTALTDRLAYLATFGPAIQLALTMPEAKRDFFAEQAWSYNRAVMINMTARRRYTILCTWLQQLQGTLLDDLTESLIKVLRGVQHTAEEALDDYRKQHQHRTDTLVRTLRDVVWHYHDVADPTERLTAINAVLQGRDEQLLQDCDAHLTHAGNNWAPFAWAAYTPHRAHVLRILRLLPIHALSSDRRIEQALAFVLTHATHKRMWLSVMKKEWVNPPHLPDLLRIALSIHDGRIRPSMILRLLSSGKSQLAQACRELGRVRRTGMLLRCLHDGDLRGLIHRETNKCEQFNNFVKWVGFGCAGVIRKHDRREQQKTMKYTMLVANALILYTTVKLLDGFRRLIAQGHTIDKSIVTAFNPYGIEHLMRLGVYQLALEEPVQPVDYDSPVMSPIPDE